MHYLLLEEAATAQQGGGGASIIMMIVYVVLFIGIMYFIMIRPQRKEQKKLAAMVASMEVGDCVLTNAGFIGIIIDISDDTVIVEFGNNKNCRIPMEKNAIAKVEKPGEAAA